MPDTRWFMRGVSYPNFENSIMADSTKGIIRGQDLKSLILRYESAQQTNIRTRKWLKAAFFSF